MTLKILTLFFRLQLSTAIFKKRIRFVGNKKINVISETILKIDKILHTQKQKNIFLLTLLDSMNFLLCNFLSKFWTKNFDVRLLNSVEISTKFVVRQNFSQNVSKYFWRKFIESRSVRKNNFLFLKSSV